jgi:predicted TIM-barrel fold metal-dependent hydrolase
MVDAPLTDDDVVTFWTALGLPGIVDVHVHFMPANVMAKVWAYFDSAGPLTGRAWPIQYRWPEGQRLAHLRSMGVRAFPSLVYAHKPGMAAWLNGWAAQFAATHDDVVHTATFFPESGVTSYVEDAIRSGARLFKVHIQVGGYDPRDQRLDPVWGLLADAGVPAVVHAASGPTPGAYTGPQPFGAVLQRHPRLTAVIAHMGMPEYDAFLGYAETYDNVHVDTTMCFVDFSGQHVRDLARQLAPRLADLREKVLFGTDFPNIPYAYAHQLEALVRLGLGDEWLRDVCWNNGVRLLGLARTFDQRVADQRPCP